jgi:CubicO group peptidase (beta-lactamase class C family)
MKILLRITLLAAALFVQAGIAQSLPEARPEAVGISAERLERIAVAMTREVDAERMPGAIVAIARHGKLAYFETFGYLDRAAGIPMPEDAIFAIASMTKPIFSVAALSLYEEGRILIDDPIGAYLPMLADRHVAVDGDLTQVVPARRQPTLRDMMRHTSGYSGTTGGSAVHNRVNQLDARTMTAEEYLEALASIPLYHQPGTAWDYSLGFNLLGLVIERVTQQPIVEFLGDRIFEPLGMRNTYFTLPREKWSRQAKPLPNDPLTGEPQEIRDQSVPLGIDCGSGCLASTAHDYLMFAQMLLNRGELNGERILSPQMVDYMTADHISPGIDMNLLDLYASLHNEGYGYGLGVAVRRGDGLGGMPASAGQYHWYGSQGTAFWVDPEEELVIVFMAQTPGEIRERNRQLIPALVYQALMD